MTLKKLREKNNGYHYINAMILFNNKMKQPKNKSFFVFNLTIQKYKENNVN